MKKILLTSLSTLVIGGLFAASQQALAADSRTTSNYKGAGNGWTLDINNRNHKVDFTSSTGTVSYKYPKFGPVVRDKGGKIIYFVHNRGHQMNVQVMEKACKDSSGKAFGTTVAVVLDGTGYWGCGDYSQ